MLKRTLHILLSAAALLTARSARAQYYDWGVDPASIRWERIASDSLKIVYPDSYEPFARRAMLYMQTAGKDIDYGFRRPQLKIPVVLHTENLTSNGIVIWAPKRIEILAPPAIDTYSMPWLKQLAAHEYRHAVQYNNLNRHTFRVLYYALGQQGAFVSLLGLPLWALEGDATMMETEMSSFGRALQPSFTMAYRAKGDISRGRRNIDKWFCGSYREHIPSHYHLGYQLSAYGYTRYGRVLWDDVADYASRYPFLFFTTDLALKKYYGTRVRTLFRDTFDDLQNYWASLPQLQESSTKIPTPTTSYTTYSHPQLSDSTRIVALKRDFDRYDRLVEVDMNTGEERRIAYVGSVSTRPALGDDGRIWWTEYRRSTLWGERYDSRLCWLAPDERTPHTVRGRSNILYPTPIAADSMAWVEYSPTGIYSIVAGRAGKASASVDMAAGEQLHGLAWDDATRKLYFIALDDDGMRIGSLAEDGTFGTVIPAAYVTLSDLRAEDGRLYFGSIWSGRDEAHAFDLTTGEQWQLTRSRYGAFDPAPAGDSIVLTTYDDNGYLLAIQRIDSSRLQPVEFSLLPHDIVNPPRKHWPVVNLDTVRMTGERMEAQTSEMPSQRYRKGAHYFDAHSWAPLSYDIFEAVDDNEFNPALGATVLSQNLLSSVTSFLTYGWNRSNGSMIRGGIKYYALGPHIEIEGRYGGGKQPIYKPATDMPDPDLTSLKNFYTLTGRVSLPMQIAGGYHLRYLIPKIEWQHYNGKLYDVGSGKYYQGVNKMTSSIYFGDNVRTSFRNLLPRWGYAFKLTHTFNPTDSDFGQMLSLYGQVLTPGLMANHSLMVRALYQFIEEDKPYAYYKKELYPKGAYYDFEARPTRYAAGSVDYQFPLCYPEGGIPAVVYVKRIRLNLGFNYAYFRQFDKTARRYGWRSLNSYGVDAIFDMNLLRMPEAATVTLKLSLYKPSNRSGVHFSAGVGLPL